MGQARVAVPVEPTRPWRRSDARSAPARVEAAEAYLHALGYRECRVRLHEGELARIEVPLAELRSLAEPAVREAWCDV